MTDKFKDVNIAALDLNSIAAGALTMETKYGGDWEIYTEEEQRGIAFHEGVLYALLHLHEVVKQVKEIQGKEQ